MAIRVAIGVTPEEMARGKHQRGEGILGKIIQHGVPMVIPDIGAEPQFLDRTRSREDPLSHPVALLAVPIKAGGETLGVLSVDRVFAERVSFEEDMRVLAIVASLIGQAVTLQQRVAQEREALLERTRSLQQAVHSRYRPENLVGQNKRMREMHAEIRRVSHSRATVLSRGESGTGKELLARVVPYNSPRANGPFVKIDCAALPQTVLEGELLGHEKGAFTGAAATKRGRSELADGGACSSTKSGTSQWSFRPSPCASYGQVRPRKDRGDGHRGRDAHSDRRDGRGGTLGVRNCEGRREEARRWRTGERE